MSNFTKKELAALAMHEIMKREQQKYAERIAEQRKIALMSDESLAALVNGQGATPAEGDK